MPAGVLVLVFLGLFSATLAQSTNPSFCSEVKECFTFRTICQGQDYEVREYDASVWVGTYMTGKIMSSPSGFWRLFRYIQGKNENGVKIDMTAPVVTKVSEVKAGEKVAAMYFLVPSANRDNPPAPTSTEVFIENFPAMTVFVRTFGGWMTKSTREKKLNELADSLNRDQESYNTEVSFSAGYNSPMKLFSRHNEVWYLATGQPKCTSNKPE